MKKNFLKKLAFTMAFATAFTALSPAAGVFAAAKPSLTVGKTLTLLLGTDRAENDINVKNKVKGSKYAWTTSNKAVATVDKNGVVVAKKTGTAKVTLKITLPTKKTQTLTTTVNVKDNIKEVAISNADKLPEALAIGEEFDFNRTIVSTFGGNKTAHKGAVTRWVVTDAEGKATETATANDSGVFVATAPGEYLVKAVSFQSKAKYADFLKGKDTVTATSEAVKVVVANTVETVKQHNLNSVDITFKAPITKEEFNSGDVHVNYVIGDVNIQEQKIKSVEISADGKVVNVALHDPFVPEGTYRVTYGKKAVATFKAAKVAADEVVGIKFATANTITVADPTTLVVNLYNKDGVIINHPASSLTTIAGLNARVEFTQAADTYHLTSLVGDKLTIFKENDTATVTATFHTYTYDGYKENVFTDTKTFVGVNKPSDTAKEVVAWTIGKVGAPNWKDAPKFIAVEDAGRRLFVEVLLQDGTTKYNTVNDTEGKLKLTSSNSSILFVDELGYLNAVREGKVIVTVEYNKLYVGSFEVVVNAKRTITALVLDKTNDRLSNASGLNDSTVVEAKLVDQYGDVIENSADLQVSAVKVSGPSAGLAIPAAANKNKITFNAQGSDEGVYAFEITHPGSATLKRHFNLTVQAPNGPAVTWRLDMAAEHDLKIAEANDVTKVQTVALYGYAANGVKATKESNATGFTTQVVSPDGKPYTVIDGDFNVDLITVSGTSVSGGNLVHKADLGNYTITAYKGTTPVARGTFKVVDTQAKPVFTVKNFETTAVTTVQAVSQAFTIKLHDAVQTINEPTHIDVTGTAVKTRYRINHVIVEEGIAGGYVLQHKLPIGYYVTVSPDFVY